MEVLSGEGHFLYSATKEGIVKVWETHKFTNVKSLTFAQDNEIVAKNYWFVASLIVNSLYIGVASSGSIFVWDKKHYAEVYRWKTDHGLVNPIAYYDNYLFSGR
ncbi:MAG: hypothetical protein RBG13Loki_2107 [Promethearchaeota archaeon CR_4]|nr:MAG: hypothetical protein RBG13Loki_2107 [Candidatus Lokiarchaeota archaeon CR_4]